MTETATSAVISEATNAVPSEATSTATKKTRKPKAPRDAAKMEMQTIFGRWLANPALPVHGNRLLSAMRTWEIKSLMSQGKNQRSAQPPLGCKLPEVRDGRCALGHVKGLPRVTAPTTKTSEANTPVITPANTVMSTALNTTRAHFEIPFMDVEQSSPDHRTTDASEFKANCSLHGV